MKKQIIILTVLFLLLFGIVGWIFLRGQATETISPEKTIRQGAQEDFYEYLKLPYLGGRFLELDEAKSEIAILYFNRETTKIHTQKFKLDKETIFSKAHSEPHQPDFFPKKDLHKIKQLTQLVVFYLPAENEIPLARLIRVQAQL